MKFLPKLKYDPKYLTIPSGESFTIQRAGQPSHDMLICSVASCLKTCSMNITNGSASDLALEAVQHYDRIPLVHFFSSLPYLFDHLPEKGEQLIIEKLTTSRMRCIDGLLFQLYDELNEGEVITDGLITSRVIDIFSTETVNTDGSIKKCNDTLILQSTAKAWWQFWK